MVALPWLVLYITDDDPVLMSTVLATTTLPHGIFILFGGTLADRLSPLRMLLVSRSAFVLVMSSLALLVYVELIPLWLIYIYAFVLGVLGAFVIPASQSLLPAILPEAELGKANGIVMGTMQLAQMAGPVTAGWVIWLGRTLSGTPEGQADYASLALAFSVDAGAVLVAVVLLAFMNVVHTPARHLKILKMVSQGVVFCWHDIGIRLVLAYLVLISFFLHGTMQAALPLFTKVELGLSEGAYGSLYAMTGLGTVIGAGIAVARVAGAGRLGEVVLYCDLVSGIAFGLVGHVHNAWLAGALLLLMGICGGIIMVAGTTWFQKRTPGTYMGRVMGILMFSIFGLMPVSATIAGLVIDVSSVSQVMSGAGALIALVSAAGLMIPKVRNMGDLPPLDEENLYLLNLQRPE